jgi:hypothetical protein
MDGYGDEGDSSAWDVLLLSISDRLEALVHLFPPRTPTIALNSASLLFCSIISCRFVVSASGSKSFSPRLGTVILTRSVVSPVGRCWILLRASAGKSSALTLQRTG